MNWKRDVTPSGKNLGILLALASAIVFGLWPPAVRAAYADGANAAFAFLVTTTMRALTMWLFCLATRKPLFASKADLRLAVSGGFFQALGGGFAIAAMMYLPGPVAITILFSHTIMLLFFMAWRGETTLDAATIASTLSALLGLTFVIDLWGVEGGGLSLIGIAFALGSALATVSRLYVFGHMTKTRNAAVVGAETFLFSLFFVLLVMLFIPPQAPASVPGWGWTILGGASLSLGSFAMFYSISLIGSFRFSLLLKMEPVFTSIFSALLISETLHPGQYGGIALVIGSLAAYQYMDYRRKSSAIEK